MSRLLLDTHTFLWFVFGDARLSHRAAEAVADPANEKLLSIASLWEIAIKVSIGKLELGMALDQFFASEVEARELEVLAITHAHLIRLAALPFHHRDPFDRLIIAQAAIEGLPIATGDPNFSPYGVTTAW